MASQVVSTTFTVNFKNFSKLSANKVYSDVVMMGDYRWRIVAYPKGNQTDDHLSLYLDVADSSTQTHGWTIDVESFSLTVINQLRADDSKTKKFDEHRFYAKEPDWGWRSFMRLEDLNDPAKGYVVDDTLAVEVCVSIAAKNTRNAELPNPAQTNSDSSIVSTISAQSSSSLLEKSMNLLSQLSSMGISSNGMPQESLDPCLDTLEQQRKALQHYLTLSLEAIEEGNSFDEIEGIILMLIQHSTNSLEKTILKDLVSRLATFREMVPNTKSMIQNVRAKRKLLQEKNMNLGTRLDEGREQLMSLKSKHEKISAEVVEVEAEVKRLTQQKEELLAGKDSVGLELERINEQVSKDIEERRNLDKEIEEVDKIWLQAREQLAQANLTWKLHDQNLQQCTNLV